MELSVAGWMTRDPMTVAPDTSALEAHECMLRRGIRHLPVVDEKGGLVGILSVDDLRAALPVGTEVRAALPPSERPPVAGWQVGELMSYAPETLPPEARLSVAAERMAARHIGCLPIVNGRGALLGILSETDLLRALASGIAGGRPASSTTRSSPLDGLIDELRAERAALSARLDHYRREELSITGELSELPTDEAERGARRNELRLTEGLEELAARRLAAIGHALERAEQGRLGACEGCGGTIPVARLRALPGTTRCIDCARAGAQPSA
jgi:acetoin utilization protein AcuB